MRPRLAPGFAVLADAAADVVWLVAGEDVRYRLGAGPWLADLLRACDGSRPVDALVASAPAAHRADAAALLEQLVGERVLVAGTAVQAHEPVRDVVVFAQDRLDHGALLQQNAAMLAARQRWMWVTTGPAQRAYVSPLFVPDAGPCAACLLVHFKRLSPVPALHDVLVTHGASTAVVELPPGPRATLDAFVQWKHALAREPVASAALYVLHVLELAELTITAHVPVADPECVACRA